MRKPVTNGKAIAIAFATHNTGSGAIALDSDEMKMVPANPAVGHWSNNGPEMLKNSPPLLGFKV